MPNDDQALYSPSLPDPLAVESSSDHSRSTGRGLSSVFRRSSATVNALPSPCLAKTPSPEAPSYFAPRPTPAGNASGKGSSVVNVLVIETEEIGWAGEKSEVRLEGVVPKNKSIYRYSIGETMKTKCAHVHFTLSVKVCSSSLPLFFFADDRLCSSLSRLAPAATRPSSSTPAQSSSPAPPPTTAPTPSPKLVVSSPSPTPNSASSAPLPSPPPLPPPPVLSSARPLPRAHSARATSRIRSRPRRGETCRRVLRMGQRWRGRGTRCSGVGMLRGGGRISRRAGRRRSRRGRGSLSFHRRSWDILLSTTTSLPPSPNCLFRTRRLYPPSSSLHLRPPHPSLLPSPPATAPSPPPPAAPSPFRTLPPLPTPHGTTPVDQTALQRHTPPPAALGAPAGSRSGPGRTTRAIRASRRVLAANTLRENGPPRYRRSGARPSSPRTPSPSPSRSTPFTPPHLYRPPFLRSTPNPPAFSLSQCSPPSPPSLHRPTNGSHHSNEDRRPHRLETASSRLLRRTSSQRRVGIPRRRRTDRCW